MVEQGIENPRVGGSIPSPATTYSTKSPSSPDGLFRCASHLQDRAAHHAPAGMRAARNDSHIHARPGLTNLGRKWAASAMTGVLALSPAALPARHARAMSAIASRNRSGSFSSKAQSAKRHRASSLHSFDTKRARVKLLEPVTKPYRQQPILLCTDRSNSRSESKITKSAIRFRPLSPCI